MGDKIPFPVWMIPFLVLKINFETLGTNEKHLVKDILSSEAWKGCKISQFPVWTIPFPVSKINVEPLGANEKYL